MNDTEILRWQEAVSSLPDKQFFNIMRLYLGEIKTLDASKSNGENILAGNALDNVIIAGSGKTSLWGGDFGNEALRCHR